MTAELGSVDRITSIVGERGTGKSTLAILDARDFQAETGALVIGHSPRGQIGALPDVVFHDDLRSLEKGLQRYPERMHFIASGATPEEVIEYARVLSLSIRRRAVEKAGHRFNPNRPPPAGIRASPILVVIDEGTHLKKAATNGEQAELEQFLTSARHEHIAFTMLIQAPSSRNWVFQEQSNRFRVFRYTHQWGWNNLRAAGVKQEDLMRVQTLPNFEYLSWNKQDLGRVEWRRVEPASKSPPVHAPKSWWERLF